MGFTPDTIKQTLLGFISSQAAVSEKYTTIQNAFTRTRRTGGQAPLTKCERGVRTIFGPNVERC